MNNHLSAYYVLSNDIDLSNVPWTPIGPNFDNTFNGNFNGQGYTISNLSINTASSDGISLFGAVGPSGWIENLTIDGAVISGTGRNFVGTLAGSSSGYITNVNISNTNVEGSSSVGGLVGMLGNGGFIVNAHVAVTVVGQANVGGLVGEQYWSSITNSYSTGNVTGGYAVGGLVGYADASIITNSFASGLANGLEIMLGNNANNSSINDSSWTNFIVNFESNGGSNVNLQGLYNSGPVFPPAAPSKEGYAFFGWYSDKELTISYDFNILINAHTTLYAKWNLNGYEVTFDKNGGDAEANPMTISANYGTNVGTLPTMPTLAGYTFTGWNTAADGSGTVFEATTAVMGDITVYAQWMIINYTVNFEINGETGVASQKVSYNGTVINPGAPTKVGHTFIGWFSDAGLDMPYSFSSMVTGTITLYAKWESYLGEEDLVDISELYQTQFSVNMAYLAVSELTDSTAKNELLERIEDVQSIIDNSTIDIGDMDLCRKKTSTKMDSSILQMCILCYNEFQSTGKYFVAALPRRNIHRE